MTPIIFGLIALLLLLVLIYRTYIAMKSPTDSNWYRLKEFGYGFDFEIAPELMPYPGDNLSHLNGVENSIQIVPERDFWLVCWKLDQATLNEDEMQDNQEANLVLRIYESSDMLRHHDIHVNKLEGCCRLHLQAHRAYYASIGSMENNRFYPIAFSNTIIPNHLSEH